MAAPLRWRRIGWISAVLVASTAAAFALSWRLSQPPDRRPPPFHSRPASDAEQVALVEALRQDPAARFLPTLRKLPTVEATGLSFCPGGRRPEITDTCGRGSGDTGLIIVSSSFDLDFDTRPAVARDFRRALIDANLSPRILPIPPGSASPTETGFEGHARGVDDDTDVLQVTRAVVSQDGAQALIYVVRRKHRHDAWGALLRLHRANGQWHVQNAFVLWMT